MLHALETYFPTSFTWTRPEGGMFVWITGPKNFDAKKQYMKAVEKNVAYVPGTYFYVNKGAGKNTLRLNFTNVDESTIEAAIKTLSQVITKKV